MRVDCQQSGATFHYRIHLQSTDRTVGRRGFGGVIEDRIRLVAGSYRMELPRVFARIHPDLHAAAIWYVLHPFIGERLELPFGVTAQLAEQMLVHAGVALEPVDPALEPRVPPRLPRPALLFSGGADSVAASLLLAPNTVALMLDRMVLAEARDAGRGSVVEMSEARAVCRELQKLGGEVAMVHDGHEALFSPYPIWHSEMSRLLPLYLADTFDIDVFETGDVLDVFGLGGYHDGSREQWVLRPRVGAARRASPLPASRSPEPWSCLTGAVPVLGLTKASSIAGLSEVASASIVNRSPFRRKVASCYFHADPARSDSRFCLRCDKCFRKLLLSYVDDGEECPPEVIDGFLAQPHLRAGLRRPYLDWHHVYYYLFQRLRCRHPFVQALRRQTEQGPDLGMLEKWYPPAETGIPAAYRAGTLDRIRAWVDEMSDEEVRRLNGLEVPPLDIPAEWTGP